MASATEWWTGTARYMGMEHQRRAKRETENGGEGILTRDVADIFDSLRRTQQELDEAIARSLEEDPLDLEVQELGPDGETRDHLLEEIESILAHLEDLKAGLAARLGGADQS